MRNVSDKVAFRQGKDAFAKQGPKKDRRMAGERNAEGWRYQSGGGSTKPGAITGRLERGEWVREEHIGEGESKRQRVEGQKGTYREGG